MNCCVLVTSPHADVLKVSTYFSKLRYLETLNVRNSPEAPIVKHWFPNDYVIEALVTLLVDVLKIKARRDRPRLLKTIGVGSHTYGNAVMGANHYPMHKAADFLQLRIYRVNYGHSSRGSNSPRPHLIAKGTPADAYGEAENLDIFNVYWLDAAIQKPWSWETESMRRA